MDKLSVEQRESLCQKIDNLARRGILADWGYAVPIAPSPSPSPSPSPTIDDPELRLGSSAPPDKPSPSVVDKPILVADGIPVTGLFNQTPTSPIEPPDAQDVECVNYVPVVGVGSHDLETKLIPVSELNPFDNIVLLTGTRSPEDDPRYTIEASPLYRTVSVPLIGHLESF